MFTGIIETTAEVTGVQERPEGRLHATFKSPISSELKVDQSVAHDGVCLTVVDVIGDEHSVDIIRETIARSNFGDLERGMRVNLERSMVANGRLDGHIVQGHVDTTAIVAEVADNHWSFDFDPEHDLLVVMKGSICVNGVSLTVSEKGKGRLGVDLIPYTLEHTNLGDLATGSKVNIEFDILGKYVQNFMMNRSET